MPNGAPNVRLGERNLAGRVATTPGVYSAIVVAANKGPVNVPYLVTNDTQYLDTFTPDGTVGVDDDMAHHSALKYLESSDKLWVIRAADNPAYGGVHVAQAAANSGSTGTYTPNMSAPANALFAIIGDSPGVWNNDLYVSIEADDTGLPADAHAFKITVHYKTDTPVSYTVSRKNDVKDGYGQSLFIEDVINDKSSYIRVVNFDVASSATLPQLAAETTGLSAVFAAAPSGGTTAIASSVTITNNEVSAIAIGTAGAGYANNAAVRVSIRRGTTEIASFNVTTSNTGGIAAAEITAALNNAAVNKSAVGRMKLTQGTNGGTVASSHRITAVKTLENPDSFDVKLFMDGGAKEDEYHNEILRIASTRRDSHAIIGGLDITYSSDVSATVNAAIADVTYDNTYGAAYFPEIRHFDHFNQRRIWLSPDGYVAGKISEAATNGNIWDPVAGVERGHLDTALDLRVHLTQGHMDLLYNNNINPIRRRRNGSFYIWGQKTLKRQAAPDDRLNVRLMLSEIQPDIKEFLEGRLNNLNTQAERAFIASRIDSYMSVVQSRNGVYRFETVCNDTNNTSTTIAAMNLVVWLFVWPTRAAEYITFETIVAPTGVTINPESLGVG